MRAILFLIAILILYFGCNRQPLDTDKTPDGFKKVSLNSGEIFQGDLRSNKNISAFYALFLPDSSRQSLKREKLSPIEFKEVRVIVLNSYNAQKNFYRMDSKDFKCQLAQSNYTSFYGRNLNDWNNLVAGLREYIYLDVIYSAKMDINMGEPEGEILVKPGMNIVIACFIDAQGKIIWTSYANYFYLSEILKELDPNDTVTYRDGWAKRSYYSNQPGEDSVWMASRFESFSQVADDSCQIPSFTYSYLPGLLETWMLGYNQEYADYLCNGCRIPAPPDTGHIDTTASDTSTQWRACGAEGFSIGSVGKTRLVMDNSQPCIAYLDSGAGNRVAVRRWNPAGTWDSMGLLYVTPGNVTTFDFGYANSTYYLLYNDTGAGNRLSMMTTTDRVSWDLLGPRGFAPGAAREAVLAFYNGNPKAAYASDSLSGRLCVMRINTSTGTTWEIDSMGVSTGGVSNLAMKGVEGRNVCWLAFCDSTQGNKVAVLSSNGAVWAPFNLASPSMGAAASISLSGIDTPWVAFQDQGRGSRAFVYWNDYSNTGNWILQGDTLGISPGSAYNVVMAGDPLFFTRTKYVAYCDGLNGYTVSVKKWDDANNRFASIGAQSVSSGAGGNLSMAVTQSDVPWIAYADGSRGGRLTVKRFENR